ncbi:MAG TPA: DNA sulfur modification protein DndB [Nitrospirae bacterium]|nr:hypothetical protein BMS3Abin10_01339 [bacterium BMS3Abin10]HDO25943.1 DNA sulfur modification protein DndB [Nitrospirota bacterium]
MKISFPAMKGNMGKRDYYVAMIKLNLIPKIFSYHDWGELPPEQRAQRVLQKSRIPEITQYILNNEDGYLFSSLTASYNGEEVFRPYVESPELGILELPLDSQFEINDGQHRMAAIIEALKQNPTLANETISVVFFPFQDLNRMQQMFSDLNRTVKVTSKSLNILYDHRDLLGQLVLDAVERVSVFKNMVDKDRVSLPIRSPKLFTLSAVYGASRELVGVVTSINQDEKAEIINNYWEAVGANIRQWKQVQQGELRPSALRAEYVHSHAVVLWGIGAMGKALIQEYPTNWQSKLTQLSDIDWRRTSKEWQGVCMQGTDIVNRSQTRKITALFMKYKMGFPLTSSEENLIKVIRGEIEDETIGNSGDGKPPYYYNYLQQIGNPDSMISRMQRCIKGHKQISYENMTKIMQEQYGYQISGSIAACIAVLKGEEYIKVEGRGADRQFICLRD